jgi:GMP synthase-like glutamine amidotransferase
MARRIHVAVLDTDSPVPAVYAARGLYSSQFRVRLQAEAARLNTKQAARSSVDRFPIELDVSAWDVVGGSYPPLSLLRTGPRSGTGQDDVVYGPIDAILVTGSLGTAFEFSKYPWIAPLQSWIQTVFAEFPLVKMLGSCFGHQIIAQALLSRHNPALSPRSPSVLVERNPAGLEAGMHATTLTPEFVACFPAALASLPAGQWRLQLMHSDHVTYASAEHRALPAPWVNVGSTPACAIQGLYHPGRVLTYQGHFEFDVWSNRECLLEVARLEKWSQTQTESYLTQLGPEMDPDDSSVAAEVWVRFLTDSSSASAATKERYTVVQQDDVKMRETVVEIVGAPAQEEMVLA